MAGGPLASRMSWPLASLGGGDEEQRLFRTYIFHVVIIVKGILFAAIQVQVELAGHLQHLAIAVLVLEGQHGYRRVHPGHLEEFWQIQAAPAVQGLCPVVQGGPTESAELGLLGFVIRAAFALPREQGLSLTALGLLLEAGGPAQAVPARAAAAPVGTGGAAEAGLGEGRRPGQGLAGNPWKCSPHSRRCQAGENLCSTSSSQLKEAPGLQTFLAGGFSSTFFSAPTCPKWRPFPFPTPSRPCQAGYFLEKYQRFLVKAERVHRDVAAPSGVPKRVGRVHVWRPLWGGHGGGCGVHDDGWGHAALALQVAVGRDGQRIHLHLCKGGDRIFSAISGQTNPELEMF